MRTSFVLMTIVSALVLGVIAGAAESRTLMRALIIGFIPTIWLLSYLLERITGREMWHFSAPYPHRWMRDGDDTIDH